MLNNKDIHALREDYQRSTLELEHVDRNPIVQFDQWFQEARNSELPEPNAMVLASATLDGRPSARVVLLKGFSESGFAFYTNYESQKGKELLENPYAALVFNWLELERQIRIEGRVEKMSVADSEAYFQSRPKGSQIGAWASPQSSVIKDRQLLEDNVRELKNKYEHQDQLPRPPHWGGFVVVPDVIEFWQGRSSRLHDRIVYRLIDEEWKRMRLAP
ncbi:MAG: pyridoxamine 5'-phosphate oxidase [Bacteroidota bacterium]